MGMDGLAKPERRRRLPPSARRDQILKEAIELLSERGAAFNTRELSERLGISHPLLFRYFPSKEDIIEAVFQTVFVGRLSPAIQEAFARVSDDPVRKWSDFYTVYAPRIFDRIWVRIFISSALQEDVIAKRYFDMLIVPLVTALAEDTERHCLGAVAEPASPCREMSLELAWMTHSSLFYNGLRRWVYQLEVPDDIAAIMARRVRAHFVGAAAALDGLVPAARLPAKTASE